MASGWNLWVWLECIGVVSGCCCKEVYRYPHNNYYFFSPYTPLIYISSFLAAASLFLYSFFIQAPPAKTMSRSIIVHTLLSLRILHSLEHPHFMGGFLAEYLGISSDVHHSLL